MPSPPSSVKPFNLPASANPPDLPPTRLAMLLGYAGLIPFVALSIATWWVNGVREQQQVLFALLAYGAAILSFLGAIHWGLALQVPARPPSARLVWGVVPSLMAWLALMWRAPGGLWLLVVGLLACYAVDRHIYPRYGIQGWLGMRLALTAIASLCCMATLLVPR